MPHFDVSVVIPSTVSASEIEAIRRFRTRRPTCLRTQFVVLVNERFPTNRPIPSLHEDFDGFAVVSVPNERYFGSCEDNLARTRTLLPALGDYTFFVGDHDDIDWVVVEQSVHRARSQGLGALAWNVMNCQRTEDGAFDQLPGLSDSSSELTASVDCRSMVAGAVMRSDVGFASLIAQFGPLDWAAYLGNHLYSRRVLARVLSYRTVESVYSLVYMQAAAFTDFPVLYGVVSEPAIYRRSDDFLRLARGQSRSTWLQEHRTVYGGSPFFHVAMLKHILELRPRAIASLFLHSLCYAHKAGPAGFIETISYSFFLAAASTAENVLGYLAEARTNSGVCAGANLFEVRYLAEYFRFFSTSLMSRPASAEEAGAAASASESLRLATALDDLLDEQRGEAISSSIMRLKALVKSTPRSVITTRNDELYTQLLATTAESASSQPAQS
jgi:hypothetical protein